MSTKDVETENTSGASDMFFAGGKDEVRELLVAAVRKARKEQGITPRKLDELCFFKEDGYPTCNEFEKDPSKMTQAVFCRAACALDLKVDEVLDLRVVGSKLDTIVDQMGKRAGLAAALPLTRSTEIPHRKVAPVYAAIKILSEV